MATGASLRVPGFANSQRVADCIDASEVSDAALLAGEVTARNAAILVAAPTGVSTWTPTITASGSMTISAPVVVEASYSTGNSPFVHFTLHLTFTTGGTASNIVIVTLPTSAIAQSSSFAIPCFLDGIGNPSGWQVISGNKINVFFTSLANLSLGAGHIINIDGKYRKV